MSNKKLENDLAVLKQDLYTIQDANYVRFGEVGLRVSNCDMRIAALEYRNEAADRNKEELIFAIKVILMASSVFANIIFLICYF